MRALARYLAGYLLDSFRERVTEEGFREEEITRVLVAPGLEAPALDAVRRMFPQAEIRALDPAAGIWAARRERPQAAVISMSGGPLRPRVACLLSGARHKLLIPSPHYLYRFGMRRGLPPLLWAVVDRLLVAPLALVWLGLLAMGMYVTGLVRKAVSAEVIAYTPRAVLVIRLMPPGVFRGLLARLRKRWPDSRLTALIASPEGESEIAETAEMICAPRLSLGELLRQLRARRPDLVILAGGADYGLGPTYWKAVLIALLSRARTRRQWEVGDEIPGRPLGKAMAAAFPRACRQLFFRHIRPTTELLARPWLRREFRRLPRRGPRLVQIGLTEACNYQCLMCPFHNPVVDRTHRESELPRISYEVYARLLADLKRMGTRGVDICGNGEPLTHPEAMDMIALARDMEFAVTLATNGFLLTEARAHRLVDLGIRRIHVSVNAGTSDTYATIHPGTPPGTFETIIQRLREMADYADATGQPRVQIEYSVVLNRLNMHELEEMVQAAHQARAGWLVVILMGPARDQPDLPPRPEDWPQIRQGIARAGELAERLEITSNLDELGVTGTAAGTRTVYEHIPCYIGHEFALIVGGGAVMFCCHCVHSPMGDLNKEAFATIWKSQIYQQTRGAAMALPATRVSLPDCGCFYACSHVGGNVDTHRRLYGKRALRWMK